MQAPKPENRSSNGKDPTPPSGWSACLRLPRGFISLRVVVLLLAWRAMAGTQYSIDWSSIDGGGGTSTGGVYTVSGTIGQPDAGGLAGGSFTLAGGFWSIIAAIQTPGAPLLSITRTNDAVTLSWPLTGAGFSLEQTSNLGNSPGTWTPVTAGQYQTNATHVIAVVPITPGNAFFRLRKP
jgi:hypothetical protein